MSSRSLMEATMFIRKALFVFLLLESTVSDEDWTIDWRWLSDLS